RDGAPATVAIATAPIARGTRVDDRLVASAFDERVVPRAYVPAGAIGAAEDLLGTVAAVDLPRGAYLTAADFSGGPRGGGVGFRLREGERAITVNALVAPDGAEPSPGRRADMLASGVGGGATTALVISGAEILAVANDAAEAMDSRDEGAGTPDAGAPGRRRVTLRVTAGQAPAVVRADAFAKELRLVMRP
ncbi:MAG: hypothetical protein JJE27_03405, partial [Thermoleophilia bacterium]|nr:hypothetical protein [Thermoleophilia bacterium]